MTKSIKSVHCLLNYLFVLRLNVPVNNFSVMSGRSQRFLGLTSTVGSQCVLLKDTTRCRLWGSNPGPLDSGLLNYVLFSDAQ